MFNPKNILIIRFSALGDLVLTSPIFRELKRIFPEAEITLLTSSGSGTVLRNNPHIDHFIWHNRKENYSDLKDLIKNLQNNKYDLIYDAHRSLRSIWIVLNLTRFGFGNNPKTWFINKRSWQRSLLISFKLNLLKNTLSQRQHILLPLQSHTHLVLNNYTELFPDTDTVKQINDFLNKNNLHQNQYVAIGASASYPIKRWPLKYFQQLISELIKRNFPVVLIGGDNEPENTHLERYFSGKIINAAGKFSPLESAELLRNARIVITNDTSISHLAEAMQTPAIVFFGPTVGEFGYTPFLEHSVLMESKEKLSCRPCSRDGRGRCINTDKLKCLTSITPEMVLSVIPKLHDQNSKKIKVK